MKKLIQLSSLAFVLSVTIAACGDGKKPANTPDSVATKTNTDVVNTVKKDSVGDTVALKKDSTTTTVVKKKTTEEKK